MESTLYYLLLGRNDLEAEIDKLTMEERQQLLRDADGLLQNAAFLDGYLEQRGCAGCGDNGHEDGIKQGNKTLKKVRKALGYTQP